LSTEPALQGFGGIPGGSDQYNWNVKKQSIALSSFALKEFSNNNFSLLINNCLEFVKNWYFFN